MMKPINTSLYDFAQILEGGYVYVDKTDRIYELARPDADRIYYFPRPRRFGKSLLLSTLKYLFEGRRDLFKGLAVEKTEWDWDHEIYPVVQLDMSMTSSDSIQGFKDKLNELIRIHCEKFGVTFRDSADPSTNFLCLLEALPAVSAHRCAEREKRTMDADERGKYVLLIDEYDSPVAKLIGRNRDTLETMRDVLYDFYIQAKSHCGDMRFLMVTGVTKFARMSVFSAFNNPKDLTFDARTADLLGYTHEEMERYFHEHIQTFADAENVDYSTMYKRLLEWYDSYQFAPTRLIKVINPVSLGNALSNRKIENYWEATAGSSLIFDAMKAGDKSPFDFADVFDTSTLNACDPLEAPLVALMYQGGYLTIERPDEESDDDESVYLKIPNQEVRRSLAHGYAAKVLGRDFALPAVLASAKRTANRIVREGIGDFFRSALQNAYSKLPHDWICKDEKEAKRYFLCFMAFARANVVGEVQVATGRPDAVLETDKAVYIFEFKYNRSAEEALRQCRNKNYAASYAVDSRAVFYVGVNYNPAEGIRTVDSITCELAHAAANCRS